MRILKRTLTDTTVPNLHRWLAALALLCALPAIAATVYKTVDENGVVSYSDTMPEGQAPVETLQISAQTPPVSEETRRSVENMRETTDRLVADRMAREKHRAQMRQLQAQTEALQNPAPLDHYQPVRNYYDVYRYPTRRPGWRDHRRDHAHPDTRPPLRSGEPGPPSTIRPLPSNNYPASLIRRHYLPEVREAMQR